MNTTRKLLGIALGAIALGVAPLALAQADAAKTSGIDSGRAPHADSHSAPQPDAAPAAQGDTAPAQQGDAQAAPQGNDNDAAAAAPSDSDYSDAELKSFADAALEVQQSSVLYSIKLHGMSGDVEQRQLVESAVQEMTKAVEQHGMSAPRFHQILREAQSQPALGDRINKKLNE